MSTVTDDAIVATAKVLASRPTSSYLALGTQELTDGIAVMLDDLRSLAESDGCIAAAWALEFAIESAIGDQS